MKPYRPSVTGAAWPIGTFEAIANTMKRLTSCYWCSDGCYASKKAKICPYRKGKPDSPDYSHDRSIARGSVNLSDYL